MAKADLLTIDEVREELDIDTNAEDHRLRRYITSVSVFLGSQTGHALHYDAGIVDTAQLRYDPPQGAYEPFQASLSRFPVVSIDEIAVGDRSGVMTVLPVDEAITARDDRWGTFELWGGGVLGDAPFYGPSTDTVSTVNTVSTVKTTFSAGYWTPGNEETGTNRPDGVTTLPEDLADAALQLVTIRDGNRGVNRSATQQRMGSVSVTYAGNPIPDDIMSVIKHYRRDFIMA